jgi:6,7-dimethyl-8-ribityllumazine synthase
MLKQQKKEVIVSTHFARGLKIAIVRTNYHTELVDNLESYCRETLQKNYLTEEQIETFIVPGSWEIPLMVQRVAESELFDAIIVFGVIVKGETHHFDMIANEVGSALMSLSLDYDIPVILEVLAVYEKKYAEERAGKNNNNKGIEAAIAALTMIKALIEVPQEEEELIN